MSEIFIDRLYNRIHSSKSVLVAGFDPQLTEFPKFILDEAQKKSANEERAFFALTSLFSIALPALSKVAAIKPNIAFFEQYGIGGVLAFSCICTEAREAGIPIIADVKRGDIGSTAAAYANAYLSPTSPFGEKIGEFEVDAVTVNPFLGFDTLDPFLRAARENGKGLFILVQTSNPGASDIQGIRSTSGISVSEGIANWIKSNSEILGGSCGYSGLGAVVGATTPAQAISLRKLMPKSVFLIPGFGAQGATASDAVAGFDDQGGAGVVNASRGIFGGIKETKSREDLYNIISERIDGLNADLNRALAARSKNGKGI